jgi:hypothetical protein
MNCRSLYPSRDERTRQIKRDQDDRTLAEERTRLFLLSFLLTADAAKAEQCYVDGLDVTGDDNEAFRDWAHLWARRVVVENALRLIAPHPEAEAKKSKRIFAKIPPAF